MITIVLTLLSTFLANLLSVGVTNLFNLSFDIYKEDLIEYVEECGYKIDKKLKKAEIIEVVKKIELNLDIFESDLVSNSNINKSENLKNTKNEISKTEKTENTKENSKNGIRFKDIAGLKEAKESFEEKVILPFSHKELFEKYGKKMGGGILLYGLPGTGKTMFAEAASNEVDAKFFPIKSSDIKSK
ncbi:hypothetical protein FQR65_LT16457 [Abscondita terminalis]|nr:hypothetical protein FQR65_LT16457 [Abscondita terminalis]